MENCNSLRYGLLPSSLGKDFIDTFLDHTYDKVQSNRALYGFICSGLDLSLNYFGYGLFYLSHRWQTSKRLPDVKIDHRYLDTRNTGSVSLSGLH